MQAMAKHRTTWRKRLDALRARMGLSQIEFAEGLGVEVSTLRFWLYRNASPGGSAVKLIEMLERLHGKSAD